MRGQKSATGNFAIPDSLDEDNFVQLKNGNQRLSSTVGNMGSSSRRGKNARDSLDDHPLPGNGVDVKKGLNRNEGVKVNKSNSSNRTVLGNDDDDDGGDDYFDQYRGAGGGDQQMAPDNDKEQELETKQVTYQEDEVEDDDDMFGGFDAGGDEAMAPPDEDEDGTLRQRRKKMKRKVSGVQRVDEESKEGENNNIETKDKNDDTDVLFAPEGDESMPATSIGK